MKKIQSDTLTVFKDFSILKINFELFDKMILKKNEGIPISVSFKGDDHYDKDEKLLFVELEVGLFDKEDAPPFRLAVKGRGVFKVSSEIDNIEKVARINCAAIIFPFIRETIADVTRRAGLRPLLLPPVNFQKMYEEERSKSDMDTKTEKKKIKQKSKKEVH